MKNWLKHAFPRLHKASRVLRGHPAVFLSYPLHVHPRYGYSREAHPELYKFLNNRRSEYRELLLSFGSYSDDLRRISLRDSAGDACWLGSMLPPLDSAALYCLLRMIQPKRYLEIGSGYSTKMTRRAARDANLQTEIISIDPHPRLEVDAICDRVIREYLENADLAVFDELQSGDILFFDGSHCCYTNSDVTVFFLEVLPRLKRGVIVQIHDIALPYDYPPDWNERFYSEQYLLACCLINNPNRYNVLLPSHFVSRDQELNGTLQPLWEGSLARLEAVGTSFWLTIA